MIKGADKHAERYRGQPVTGFGMQNKAACGVAFQGEVIKAVCHDGRLKKAVVNTIFNILKQIDTSAKPIAGKGLSYQLNPAYFAISFT
ncbi:hypothetical protein MHZ90_20615 [Pantoea sp. ACRSH]|uniref:hypothetical protein n=1 Tax=unclassified Pantoea TaxID=2630326 RepID=UPI001EF525BB|nr:MULTISPECIES: hypothetical protein [unclassified Pantoea]MCG7368504.1 hypothetical protein [Pantoea sp. ACRSH]MCG7398872.1 hypothetical protein [Pantoea sp. ACRSC]